MDVHIPRQHPPPSSTRCVNFTGPWPKLRPGSDWWWKSTLTAATRVGFGLFRFVAGVDPGRGFRDPQHVMKDGQNCPRVTLEKREEIQISTCYGAREVIGVGTVFWSGELSSQNVLQQEEFYQIHLQLEHRTNQGSSNLMAAIWWELLEHNTDPERHHQQLWWSATWHPRGTIVSGWVVVEL